MKKIRRILRQIIGLFLELPLIQKNLLHIHYLLLENKYNSNIKRIKQKIRNNEKIRVAFFVNDIRWKCQNLYDLLLKNENYEPFIIIGKHIDNAHLEVQNDEQLIELENFYKNLSLKTHLAYDFSSAKFIPLETYKPDIIFYSRQWGLTKEHDITITAKDSLTCYVPYFLSNSPAEVEAGDNFHNLVWKYFVINDDLKNEYKQVMPNKGKNLQVVGYPNLDGYLKTDIPEKKYVIYAPHWTVRNEFLNYATFEWNGQFLLYWARQHPDINWVFRPHPILKNVLLHTGVMTQDEIDNYYNEWAKIGINFEGVDYIDLFRHSKALITDCGSFLAEYLPSKNPVILLRSSTATPYNFLAQKVTQYYYKAHNLEELEKLLEEVIIKGIDNNKDNRLKALEDLQLLTNASENILNYFNNIFDIN